MVRVDLTKKEPTQLNSQKKTGGQKGVRAFVCVQIGIAPPNAACGMP